MDNLLNKNPATLEIEETLLKHYMSELDSQGIKTVSIVQLV